jgi:superfamily II DNA/RNA helicase
MEDYENDNKQMYQPQENKLIKRLKSNKQQKGFYAFNLNNNLINAIKTIGYRFPTPIQRKTIPEILSGFNLIVNSRTGNFLIY